MAQLLPHVTCKYSTWWHLAVFQTVQTHAQLERVGRPQPQSCPPAWEQDEMLINEWGKCDIMSYYLHVKSGDDSLNGIAVISRTIFVENWLWRPSCFSEIAENQYQPSLCHLISVLKVWWWYIHNFSFNWSDVVKILSQQKIGCGGHLVFQKLLKINTSQAYATLYPYKTYGGDIFITFPLIDRTSSIFWVSKK